MADYIAISAAGRALGENNPRAKLTDRDVRTMRQMRESDPKFWTYAKLAHQFECHPRYAEKICKREKRLETAPAGYRRVGPKLKNLGHGVSDPGDGNTPADPTFKQYHADRAPTPRYDDQP